MTKRARALFRACLRSVRRMPSYNQRVTWLHYTRLKFDGSRRINDQAEAEDLLCAGWEEVKQMNYYSDMRQSAQNAKLHFSTPSATSHIRSQNEAPTPMLVPSASTTQLLGAPSERQESVRSWLVQVVPSIADGDARAYAEALTKEGFDCPDMLLHLRKEDLLSFKVAHQRALMQVMANLKLGCE